jgi:threonine dehydrogenase-like Zn-dependent dehydrogenase
MGKHDVQFRDVPDPEIVDPTDAIIRVTSTAICGSDLHLYDGVMPGMQEGDVLGHETMGEVVAVGPAVKRLAVGDRVVVPFNISCGECWFCKQELYSLCDRSNRNAEAAAAIMGQAPGGAYGYSHLLGGYPGGQAEFLRVPFADCGPIKVDGGLHDEQVLFLSDVFPTGYMAAINCDIKPGDTVAIWGAGPVGQFAIRSAYMLGAGRVIAIDRVPERLEMARAGKAETIDIRNEEVFDRLMDMTGGRGPDSCMDAVGTEAHSTGSIDALLDKAKSVVKLTTDRAHVLREVIRCCRKGGTLSVPGVYVGLLDHIPFGAAMNKGLTIKMGQTHVARYTPELLQFVEAGRLDPSFVVTQRLPLRDGPAAYKAFRDKEDGCIKVVLTP